MPYPAFVFDRYWTVIHAIASGHAMLSGIGLAAGDSFTDFLLKPGRGTELVENWHEVAGHLAARFRLESAHLGGDAVLERAAKAPSCETGEGDHGGRGDLSPMLAMRFRFGGMVYPTFSTIMQFGTADDIALADLKIEIFFPSDEACEAFFRSMAG